jgi:hypothetical protein
MPRNMGPVAMMLMDYEHSREITKHMEDFTKEYIYSRNPTNLINYIKQ